ncbi:pilus assembly protein CpaF [Homoserinimonas aerilata]|uniref:Pilus assembly protein CpaF n=1 Tax=Homoserinimonas aerilata TaxID=1162970 RepID=A0A542YKX5_9MICO|nr:TadA family conjugal transfer-associated ATPase [Homoserinimonas aerilata]TQL48746.1 pilus assembly protein CpaF [Homoserinimonas aerilata]
MTAFVPERPAPTDRRDSAERVPAMAARFVPHRDPDGADGGGAEVPRVGRSRGGLDAFGPLTRLLAEDAVTDLFVNGHRAVWVDRGRGPERCEHPFRDEQELRELVVKIIAAGGRHIDEAAPCVDVRLGGGIRVHAVLPPVATGGSLLSVRLPRVERLGVTELETHGFFDTVPIASVASLVEGRSNLLITGAGGSGKTTLLSALLALAPANERIVTIEDVAELRIEHPHVVALEARQANLEGAGEIGLERLVREALRMRPDRLVLGECRGAEVRELLAALNTGHDGGAGTLHANSLADVPARLEALGALAGMSPTAVARQAVSAIGAVLHVVREGGRRRLANVGRFELDARDRLAVVER